MQHRNSQTNRKDKIKFIVSISKWNKMLVIKIFINQDPIDEIHIQNIGKFDTLFGAYCPDSPKRPDLYVYKIRKPEGFEENIILHTRKSGHRVLTSKAMELIKHKRKKT